MGRELQRKTGIILMTVMLILMRMERIKVKGRIKGTVRIRKVQAISII